MDLSQIIILALIQGITEFLPVSSSAHLIIPSQLFDFPDQGIVFDVAVHIGTLLAVVIYYFRDLIKIASFTLQSIVTRKLNHLSKLGWYIVIATIPACVIGYIFEDLISAHARNIAVIGFATIIFGIVLGLASSYNKKVRFGQIKKIEGERSDSLREMTLWQAIIIGCAQAIALIPGASRSGITMTAGLFLGLRPEAAARFSFLISIPIIIASFTLEFAKLTTSSQGLTSEAIMPMLIGIALTFITAIIVIHLFMKYISKSGMAIFVIYRLILGAILLYIAYA